MPLRSELAFDACGASTPNSSASVIPVVTTGISLSCSSLSCLDQSSIVTEPTITAAGSFWITVSKAAVTVLAAEPALIRSSFTPIVWPAGCRISQKSAQIGVPQST